MKWVTVTSVLLIWRRFQTFSTRTNVKDVFQRPQVHQHKASGQWTAFHFETTWNRTHSIWWPYFPPLGTARPSMTHTLWTRSPVGLYNGRCYVPGYRPRNGLLIVVYTGVRPRSGLFTTVYPGVRPRSGLLDVTYPGVRPRSGLLDVVQPGVRTRTRRGLFRVYRGVPGHPVPFTVEPSTMLWN